MKDRLEEFVKNNRKAFDSRVPDPSLWLKINPQNREERSRKKLRWLRYAAAVAIIFAGFSAGLYYLGTGGNKEESLYGDQYREMMEAEIYYSNLISKRYNELQPYFSSSPALMEELDFDLQELDEIYDELKEDLKDNAGNQEVLEAMVQNYRIKVEILEDLLNQFKEKENKNYEEKEKYSL